MIDSYNYACELNTYYSITYPSMRRYLIYSVATSEVWVFYVKQLNDKIEWKEVVKWKKTMRQIEEKHLKMQLNLVKVLKRLKKDSAQNVK